MSNLECDRGIINALCFVLANASLDPWVATQILALPEYQWLSEQRETIEPLVVTKALDLMRHSLARALDKWFEAQARSRLPDTVLFHTKSG